MKDREKLEYPKFKLDISPQAKYDPVTGLQVSPYDWYTIMTFTYVNKEDYWIPVRNSSRFQIDDPSWEYPFYDFVDTTALIFHLEAFRKACEVVGDHFKVDPDNIRKFRIETKPRYINMPLKDMDDFL